MRISDWSSDVCSSDVAWRVLARLRADLGAVDERSAGPCFAADVDDVVAVGTACDRGNLYAGLADRGQRFRQFQFLAGIGAAGDAQLAEQRFVACRWRCRSRRGLHL